MTSILQIASIFGLDSKTADIMRTSQVMYATRPKQTSKKSGCFTKKYKGRNKLKRQQDRIEGWKSQHGEEKAKQIMREQGIIG